MTFSWLNRRFFERWWAAAILDAAIILVFVLLGRQSHEEDGGLSTALGIAAPFLVGAAIPWIVSPNVRRAPSSLRAGRDVWVATVVIGLLLRRFAWDRGTAVAFIIVATGFLGLFLLGWRLVMSATSGPRSEVRSGRPPLEAER